MQRRGRAGRVSSGIWYGLISRFDWEQNKIPERRPSEMVRVALEEVCLRVRACDGIFGHDESVASVLRGCLDPPPLEHVSSALGALRVVGAMDEREVLTGVGRKLAHLPLDVKLGKMVLTAVGLECLDPVLSVVEEDFAKGFAGFGE